jgi:hypothetical protein
MNDDDKFGGVGRITSWALVLSFVLLLFLVLTTGLRPA